MLKSVPVTKQAALKFLEMQALEELQVPLQGTMELLIDFAQDLRSLPQSETNVASDRRLSSIIWEIEDANKSLSQEAGDLWRAILKTDGAALTSTEIEDRQVDVEAGLQLVERIRTRLVETECGEEDENSALRLMYEARNQLYDSRHSLAKAQNEYQLAMAEALAREAIGYEH